MFALCKAQLTGSPCSIVANVTLEHTMDTNVPSHVLCTLRAVCMPMDGQTITFRPGTSRWTSGAAQSRTTTTTTTSTTTTAANTAAANAATRPR